MVSKSAGIYPFFDPYRDGDTLRFSQKLGISLGIGAFYLLFQYYALEDKMVFFDQYCWILGIIVSTSLMALYVATDVFRSSLSIMHELEGSHSSDEFLSNWLDDKWYLIVGAIFATANTSIGHVLGVPAEFHQSVFSLLMIYCGFFMAGFAAGMGLVGIVTIIALYLKFAPSLQYSLDPNDPDGTGGIKRLGDSLWFFGMLIGAVGVLVAIYMFGVDWIYAYKPYVQVIFIFWVAFPFIVAISIVLIPGLAVRRQVTSYKTYKAGALRKEKASTYNSFKNFENKDDDEIIKEKKELGEKLVRIQNELEKLKKMRTSHIDGKE